MSIYNEINKIDNLVKPLIFNFNNINGPFLEIVKSKFDNHQIIFKNKKTGEILHSGEIGQNCWISCNYRYFIDWRIEIKSENKEFINDINFEDSKVLICIDSRSLGDNLAWIPYVEEFRKKMKCKVVCSTFQNNLFIDNYPEIEFVSPGTPVHGIVAQYNIGWYYKENGEIDGFKNPNNFRIQPMQKTASDILGLEYLEIKPLINLKKPERENIVTIAIHGTAQSKYWNYDGGWQKIVDYCKSLEYRVILISKEENGYMGNYHPDGVEKLEPGPLQGVIDILEKSKLFIGIGSGLSWLSWATNTPTCIISGFSYDYTEPSGGEVIRIKTADGKCTGCFNTHRLEASDWNWCPNHKGTDRQFECSRTITPDMVIEKINNYLK